MFRSLERHRTVTLPVGTLVPVVDHAFTHSQLSAEKAHLRLARWEMPSSHLLLMLSDENTQPLGAGPKTRLGLILNATSPAATIRPRLAAVRLYSKVKHVWPNIFTNPNTRPSIDRGELELPWRPKQLVLPRRQPIFRRLDDTELVAQFLDDLSKMPLETIKLPD
jgi:hypothetical protein